MSRRASASSVYATLALCCGAASAVLGTLAFSFPFAGLGWSMSALREVQVTLQHPSLPVMLASGLAGLGVAPFFIRFLHTHPVSSRGRFAVLSLLAGIAYLFLTAWVAIVLFVPAVALARSSDVALAGQVVLGMIAAAMGGPFIATLYLPFILVGGGLIGLLSGFVIRRMLHHERMVAK